MDALSGQANLEGIQWLLLAQGPRRVLRDQLKSLLCAGSMLGPCRLHRARFKPGRKLTAYYNSLVRMNDRAGFCIRPIAVTWGGDGDSASECRQQVAAMQREALLRGLAAPFEQLRADLIPWKMHISISPMDTSFHQLVRLMDPRYVGKMLSVARPSASAGSDQSRAGAYAVSSVRYRPGQRHVLRYDRLVGSKHTVFAKLYRGPDGAQAFYAASKVADWLGQQGKGSTSVAPLAYIAEHNVILYPGLSGMPLTACLPRQGRTLARWMTRVGTALNDLHRLPLAVTGPLAVHNFEAEVRQTVRTSAHIEVLLPWVGKAVSSLLDHALELHRRLPQEPPTFTHGDFKSEHVWCSGPGVTIIDFDSCHCGDPALDVGKFLAHLQLWHVVNNNQSDLEQAREQFLGTYGSRAPRERLLRARLYEAVELVKITARRIPLFDPEWRSLTERLIACALGVMSDVEHRVNPLARRISRHDSEEENAANAR